MRKILCSLFIWVLLIVTTLAVYGWYIYWPQPIDPPGYQESIRKHATGDNVYDLIKFLDKRPLEDTIE